MQHQTDEKVAAPYMTVQKTTSLGACDEHVHDSWSYINIIAEFVLRQVLETKQA